MILDGSHPNKDEKKPIIKKIKRDWPIGQSDGYSVFCKKIGQVAL